MEGYDVSKPQQCCLCDCGSCIGLPSTRLALLVAILECESVHHWILLAVRRETDMTRLAFDVSADCAQTEIIHGFLYGWLRCRILKHETE